MSEELTPFIAESDELLITTKKQLAKLRIRTFKGLARRKRGTLLKRIPDMSPQELRLCTYTLKNRKLDFVSDDTVTQEQLKLSRFQFSRLWRGGITSWCCIAKANPRVIISDCRLSVETFFYIEDRAHELGYKPPINDFGELDISRSAQKWLFKKQHLYSLKEMKMNRPSFEYQPIGRGRGARYRAEVLYLLWKHGIEISMRKNKKRTP